MDFLRILIFYNGSWKVQKNGGYLYMNGRSKGLIIPQCTTYNDLVQCICNEMGWDMSRSKISLAAQFNSKGFPPMPTPIESDNDVRFFIQDNIAEATSYTPLVVSIEDCDNTETMSKRDTQRRKSCTPEACVFRSASGSNQLSQPIPVLGPQVANAPIASRSHGSTGASGQNEAVPCESLGVQQIQIDSLTRHLDIIKELGIFANAVSSDSEDDDNDDDDNDDDEVNDDDDANVQCQPVTGGVQARDFCGIRPNADMPIVTNPVQADFNQELPLGLHSAVGVDVQNDDANRDVPLTFHTPVRSSGCAPQQCVEEGMADPVRGTDDPDIENTRPDPVCFNDHDTVNEDHACHDNVGGSSQEGPSTFRWMPPILPQPSSTLEDEGTSVIRDRMQVTVGELFNSKTELREKLSTVALRRGFEFKVKKSTKSRYEVVCRVDSCKWRLRATKVGETSYFQVKKFKNEHTCSGCGIHPNHRQSNAQVLGKRLVKKFVDGSTIYRPKDIIRDLRDDLGINISYIKAWRAKEIALEQLHGSAEESFRLLPQYMYMVEKANPGTQTALETDATDHFQYFFMSLGASIAGFPCIRPVIAVDGAHLKGKYRGTLFLASSMDGNNQIFPLAFGVGHSENDDSWLWFMTKLRDLDVGNVEDLVFISDRHRSIERAVSSVFPTAIHGLCTHHIKGNLKARFRDKVLVGLFHGAAYEYRECDFYAEFAKIEAIAPAAATYLREIGLPKWSRAHFPCRRYNIMTTNIAESMNSALRHARWLPITLLADFFRATLQKWFCDRRTMYAKSEKFLSPNIEKLLEERLGDADKMMVRGINNQVFEVYSDGQISIVDMQARMCSCRVFDLDQLPCTHALAVCKHMNLLTCQEYCGHWYTNDRLLHAYAMSIMPVGRSDDWVVPNNVKDRVVKPPEMRRPAGRPRRQRMPSIGEESSTRHCGRCGSTGHNRQTCRNPVPLHD